MNPFQPFLDVFGKSIACKPAPAERIAAYKGRLPGPLLEFWQAEGWCGYRDGMIWFVDPEAYPEALDEWKITGQIVFARNGFGDLYLWSEKGLSILNVHLGNLYPMDILDLDIFLNKLITLKKTGGELLYGNLFPRVVKKLGRLSEDEAYTFVPALKLGGLGTVDSVQRVKLMEMLSILAQIHGR